MTHWIYFFKLMDVYLLFLGGQGQTTPQGVTLAATEAVTPGPGKLLILYS